MAGALFLALAVVRAEREDAETFQSVFVEALRRLEALREPEPIRWRDLVWVVLGYGLLRRPTSERELLLKAARSSQADPVHREEVARMCEVFLQAMRID